MFIVEEYVNFKSVSVGLTDVEIQTERVMTKVSSLISSQSSVMLGEENSKARQSV